MTSMAARSIESSPSHPCTSAAVSPSSSSCCANAPIASSGFPLHKSEYTIMEEEDEEEGDTDKDNRKIKIIKIERSSRSRPSNPRLSPEPPPADGSPQKSLSTARTANTTDMESSSEEGHDGDDSDSNSVSAEVKATSHASRQDKGPLRADGEKGVYEDGDDDGSSLAGDSVPELDNEEDEGVEDDDDDDGCSVAQDENSGHRLADKSNKNAPDAHSSQHDDDTSLNTVSDDDEEYSLFSTSLKTMESFHRSGEKNPSSKMEKKTSFFLSDDDDEDEDNENQDDDSENDRNDAALYGNSNKSWKVDSLTLNNISASKGAVRSQPSSPTNQSRSSAIVPLSIIRSTSAPNSPSPGPSGSSSSSSSDEAIDKPDVMASSLLRLHQYRLKKQKPSSSILDLDDGVEKNPGNTSDKVAILGKGTQLSMKRFASAPPSLTRGPGILYRQKQKSPTENNLMSALPPLPLHVANFPSIAMTSTKTNQEDVKGPVTLGKTGLRPPLLKKIPPVAPHLPDTNHINKNKQLLFVELETDSNLREDEDDVELNIGHAVKEQSGNFKKTPQSTLPTSSLLSGKGRSLDQGGRSVSPTGLPELERLNEHKSADETDQKTQRRLSDPQSGQHTSETVTNSFNSVLTLSPNRPRSSNSDRIHVSPSRSSCHSTLDNTVTSSPFDHLPPPPSLESDFSTWLYPKKSLPESLDNNVDQDRKFLRSKKGALSTDAVAYPDIKRKPSHSKTPFSLVDDTRNPSPSKHRSHRLTTSLDQTSMLLSSSNPRHSGKRRQRQRHKKSFSSEFGIVPSLQEDSASGSKLRSEDSPSNLFIDYQNKRSPLSTSQYGRKSENSTTKGTSTPLTPIYKATASIFTYEQNRVLSLITRAEKLTRNERYRQALKLYYEATDGARRDFDDMSGRFGRGVRSVEDACELLTSAVVLVQSLNGASVAHWRNFDLEDSREVLQEAEDVEEMAMALSDVTEAGFGLNSRGGAWVISQYFLPDRLMMSGPHIDFLVACVETFINRGTVAYISSDYNTALKMYDTAFQLQRNLLSQASGAPHMYRSINSINLVRAMGYLATCHVKMGSIIEAMAAQQELLRIKHMMLTDSFFSNESSTGAEKVQYHVNTISSAITLLYVGQLHVILKEYRPAYSAYKEAFRMQRRILPEKCIDLAVTLHHIGRAHFYLGRRDEAMEVYRKVSRLYTLAGLDKHNIMVEGLNKDMSNVYLSASTEGLETFFGVPHDAIRNLKCDDLPIWRKKSSWWCWCKP